MATSIFLNGTSSSGKTSIARELEKILGTEYTYFSVDDYGANWTRQNAGRIENLMELVKELGQDNEEIIKQSIELTREVVSGYYASIAKGIERGLDYILDCILGQPSSIEDCITRLASYDILFVGVHCPLEILKEREIARGDRIIGTAEIQFPHVHKGKKYDIEVHTDRTNSYNCASIITDFMKARESRIPFSEKLFQGL